MRDDISVLLLTGKIASRKTTITAGIGEIGWTLEEGDGDG